MTQQATVNDDGFGRVDQATFDTIEIEVQHKGGSGLEPTLDKGFVGLTVVIMPTGQPRLVMRVSHPDGTTLDVMMPSVGMTQSVVNLIGDAGKKASALASEVRSAVRQ